MNLYLDTSTEKCILKLDHDPTTEDPSVVHQTYEWLAGKSLAENLLNFISEKLQENGKTWHDLKKITFYSGPGSFTGLRIGAAVVNTLASELIIPLENHKHEPQKIIIPDYGRPANIGRPRK